MEYEVTRTAAPGGEGPGGELDITVVGRLAAGHGVPLPTTAR